MHSKRWGLDAARANRQLESNTVFACPIWGGKECGGVVYQKIVNIALTVLKPDWHFLPKALSFYL